VAVVQPEWGALRGRAVTLVVRVRSLDRLEAARAPLLAALAQARGQGLEDLEVQIDLDATRPQLARFARWLASLRPQLGGASLSITGLATWLGATDLPALLAACDRWVLQVHGLHRQGRGWALFDDAQARRAILRAARLGRPFQVALPTFSLAVGEREGEVLEVVAEDREPAWPPGTTVQVAAAPGPELARLVADLTARRPAQLTGIIWFRLPVRDDRRNWSMAVLGQVMAGQVPAASPARAVLVADADGALTLSLDPDGLPPRQVTVVWPAGVALLASDAHAGWRTEAGATGELRYIATSGNPGRQLGWLRLEETTHARVLP
jgi:hypothetical protein